MIIADRLMDEANWRRKIFEPEIVAPVDLGNDSSVCLTKPFTTKSCEVGPERTLVPRDAQRSYSIKAASSIFVQRSFTHFLASLPVCFNAAR